MKKLRTLIALVLAAVALTACTVPGVVTQPDGTTVTNQVPDPRGLAAIETIKSINTVTAPVNPYAAPISVVLGIIGSVWALVAQVKNIRTQKLFKVVVQGIEQSASDPAKVAIANHSANAGVKLELDSAVQKIVSGG